MTNLRADPAFPLVRNSLQSSTLPVLDTENITCWENIQFSVLRLDDPQFEILQREVYAKKGVESDRKVYKDDVVANDPFLREIEDSFSKGNIEDVFTLLNSKKAT